jgi:hypothetical protein
MSLVSDPDVPARSNSTANVQDLQLYHLERESTLMTLWPKMAIFSVNMGRERMRIKGKKRSASANAPD